MHLIVTADDFGLAPEVNQAVIAAHRDGVLACASLLVAAPHATEAVALAKQTPSLRVGLHIAVVQGVSAINGAALSHGLVGASFRWALSRTARAQMRAEIRAQFAAFHVTGLALDHVNAHNHMQLHPLVLDAILAEADRYGCPPIRLPREPIGFEANSRLTGRALRHWTDWMSRRIARHGFVTNDWVAGLSDTGRMTEHAWMRLLAKLPSGVTEFYCHPATVMTPQLEAAWGADYDGPGELAALTSPRVRARLAQLNLIPSSYQQALNVR